MSTRSGKRIHSTAFDTDAIELEVVPKTEKKTRNKRLKENDDQASAIPKSKLRKHYVAYPTDDECGYTTASDAIEGSKSTRKSKKKTLKEHDINVPDTKHDQVEDNKTARVTRQTRKFAENIEEDAQNTAEASEESVSNNKVKGKKNKKKSKNSDINENLPESIQDAEEAKVVSKKSKTKKKKGKHANNSTEKVKPTLNRSNVSTDSFHSAAGSPLSVTERMDVDKSLDNIDTTLVKENSHSEMNNTVIVTTKKSSVKSVTPKKCDIETEINNTVEKDSKNKRKSIKTSTSEKDIEELKINNTLEKDCKKKTISVKCTSEKEDVSHDLNSTYDKIDVDCDDKPEVRKEPKARRSLRLNNSTTENVADAVNVKIPEKLNTTFENEPYSKKSLQSNNSENGNISNALNTTFEKTSNKSSSKIISLDSTLDKSEPKLNTTFDKIERKSNSEKSSLISSDEGTVNLTFDKEDNSRISITSDESKTNIMNTTPVLIESSMDESLSASKTFEESKEISKDVSPITKDTLQLPTTPLKREGTFTKECPDIKPTNKTPTKQQMLPSPGVTPFHITKSSNKEKSMLNVTRSIEKSRRSSLADLAPTRQTRVMFCSPMNNPTVVMQLKKKVIKSSMKGSNKSFVFEESASTATRPATRKRSYTHNDVDDTRVKRTRLADDIERSVDRLSRPRTSSTAAKLSETTPSKAPTPSKSKSEPKRTKLPNFAALHKKQFEKMESLDECQLRKKQRARKLMLPKTPNGTVMVLERNSPRGRSELKSKEVAPKNPVTPVKKPEIPAKKSETPAKKAEINSKLANLPTLESLRPGFTRFGFKMNTEFNPFSIPSQNDTKVKNNPEKPNGLTAKTNVAPKTPILPTVKPLTKQPTLPSLTGVTATRKEVAKQAVMREKSFTSLGKRDVKRNESRTIIKGVRTNRRFELQMKMRNID